jgi:REP element-mobilizing transposase RayT
MIDQISLQRMADSLYEKIRDKMNTSNLPNSIIKIGIYPIVSKIKGLLSHELREEFPQLKSKLPCLWTNSNFISSVGFVNLETIKEYICNQKNQ